MDRRGSQPTAIPVPRHLSFRDGRGEGGGGFPHPSAGFRRAGARARHLCRRVSGGDSRHEGSTTGDGRCSQARAAVARSLSAEVIRVKETEIALENYVAKEKESRSTQVETALVGPLRSG